MAIALRGASAGTPAANPTSGTFPAASISDITSGDYVLCGWWSVGDTKTLTLSDGTGFTLIESYSNATYGKLLIYGAFYEDVVSWAFTMSSVANMTTGYFCIAFSGVDGTTPVLAEASAVAVGSSTSPNPPSVACGSTTGCAIVCFLGERDDNTITATSTYTIPTGASWTSSLGNPDAGSAAQYLLNQTGTIDPGNMTIGATDPWAVHTIALKPSSGTNYTRTASAACTSAATNASMLITRGRTASAACTTTTRAQTPILVEDFNNTSEWTTGGTVTLDYDSTHTRDGQSQCVRMNLTASTTGSIEKTLSSVNLTDTTLEFWFYIDVDVYSTFQQNFELRLGTNSSHYFQRINVGGKSRPGWNCKRMTTRDVTVGHTIPYGNWSTTGSPSWSAITWMQIIFTPEADDDLKLTLCSFKYGASGKRAAFLMTHDDGDGTVYDVGRSIMNARGIHATAYVNSNYIGVGSDMTAAELQTLASEGHYIGNHCSEHVYLTDYTQSEVTAYIEEGMYDIQAISGLEDHGKHGAYPYGYVDEVVIAGLNDAEGQLTWRYTGNMNQAGETSHINPFSISCQSDLEGDDADYYQQAMDIAAWTGEAYISLIHYPGTSVTTQYFTDLCEYAAVTKGLWCPNIDEWYNYFAEATTYSRTASAACVTTTTAVGYFPQTFTRTASAACTSTASATGYKPSTATIDLDVPIELIDMPLSSTVSTQQDWLRSDEWLDPSNYDGQVEYIFEAVTSGVTATDLLQLIDVDASNQVVASITPITSGVGRTRIVFTPNTGNHCYRIRTGSNITSLKVWSARIIVRQSGATKTRVPVGLWGNTAQGSSDTGNAYNDGQQDSTTSATAVNTTFGTIWKYVAADWATITDVTLDVLAAMSASATGYVYVTDTSNNVHGTVTVTSNAAIAHYTATGLTLTDGERYILREQSDGTNTIYIHKTRLWLTLNTATKTESYWRQNGQFTTAAADVLYDYHRLELDKTRYSGTSAIYLEASAYLASTESYNYHLVIADAQQGATGGTPSLLTSAGINLDTTTVKAWFRSGDCSSYILSGNDLLKGLDYNAVNITWIGGAIVVTAQAVSAPTYTYPTYIGTSGSNTYKANADSSTCTVPAGVQANDVLLLLCMAEDLNASGGITFSPSDPSSITWNAIGSVQAVNSATYDYVHAFWRRVSSSSESGTTITTTHAGEDTTFTFGEVCVAYRDCETSGDPFDAAVWSSETSLTATHDVPAVTVSSTHRTLVVLHAHEDNTMFSSGPSGYVQRYSDVTTVGQDFSLAIYDNDDVSSDGATTMTIAASEVGATLHVSLKPPSGTTYTRTATAAATTVASATGTKIAGGTTYERTAAAASSTVATNVSRLPNRTRTATAASTTTTFARRYVPVVPTGLVTEFVGNLADDGIDEHTNADADKAVWTDLAGDYDGTLNSGFGWTSSSGWAGSGIEADPYRLVMNGDGSDNVRSTVSVVDEAGTKGFTFEAWITVPNGNVTDYNPVVSQRGTTAGTYQIGWLGFYTSYQNEASFYYRALNGTSTTAHTPVTFDGSIHHIVGTFQTGTNGQKVYVDGSNSGGTNPTPPSPTTDTDLDLSIGGLWTGAAWQYPCVVEVATVRIYDRPLTAAEVLQNYNAGPLAASHVVRRTASAACSTSATATGEKIAGGTNYTRTASAACSTTASAMRSAQLVRTATAASTSVATNVARLPNRTRTATAASVSTASATRLKTNYRTASATSVSTANATRLKTSYRTATAAVSSVATNVARVRVYSRTASAAAATVASNVARLRWTYRTASAAATTSATATASKVGGTTYERTASAACVTTASATKSGQLYRSATAAAVTTANNLARYRMFTRTATAASVSTANNLSRFKTGFRTATAASTSAATNLSRIRIQRTTAVAAASASTANNLARLRTAFRTATAASASTATAIKSGQLKRAASASSTTVTTNSGIRPSRRATADAVTTNTAIGEKQGIYERTASATCVTTTTAIKTGQLKRTASASVVSTATNISRLRTTYRSGIAQSTSTAVNASRLRTTYKTASAASISTATNISRLKTGNRSALAASVSATTNISRLRTTYRSASAASASTATNITRLRIAYRTATATCATTATAVKSGQLKRTASADGTTTTTCTAWKSGIYTVTANAACTTTTTNASRLRSTYRTASAASVSTATNAQRIRSIPRTASAASVTTTTNPDRRRTAVRTATATSTATAVATRSVIYSRNGSAAAVTTSTARASLGMSVSSDAITTTWAIAERVPPVQDWRILVAAESSRWRTSVIKSDIDAQLTDSWWKVFARKRRVQ